MFEWKVATATSSLTLWADTYMEAELEARILFGTSIRLEITQVVVEVPRKESE